MDKKDEIKKMSNKVRPVNIRDVLTDKAWNIDNLDYNDKTGKYEFEVSHTDGRKEKLQRNRQYTDNLIQELLDAKRKGKKDV